VKSLCLILFLALGATPGCSRFSKSARQERAYAKYVRKSTHAREKRQAQFRREKARIPQPDTAASSEPEVTTQTLEGSQAVPAESGNP
jgi:hypothetical protein